MLFQMVFTGVLDYEHPYSNLPNLSISSELKLVQIFYRATGKDSNYEGDFIYLFFTCHLSCSTATVCDQNVADTHGCITIGNKR